MTIGAVSTIAAQHPKIVYLKDMEGHTTTAPHNSTLSTLMRKIESQMCAAVQGNKDWQSGNTSVHFDAESGVSVVRLHGNKICLLYTSPSPRDLSTSRMPSSA